MHPDHQIFLRALAARELVDLTFIADDDDGSWLRRLCAPLDYAPGAADGAHVYDLWDSDCYSPHRLTLPPPRVVSIEPTGRRFQPGDVVTWPPNWHHPRDWGPYS